MNRNANTPKKQAEKIGRTAGDTKGPKTGKRNELKRLTKEEQRQLEIRAEEIGKGLVSSTWKELETDGKFDKNKKLDFITDETLIVGCDIGSDIHFIRAIDTRGRELSTAAFAFPNNAEGFQDALSWSLLIAAQYGKTQIVLGLEPTGHYWFTLAAWLLVNGVSVVQVNPYAVKQSKELEDNSQDKNDRKDPKLIANLVKNGNYGLPYLPEDTYATMRTLSEFRDHLKEELGRSINRLHRELTMVFPEYKVAFSRIDGPFTLSLLSQAAIPSELVALGEEGIRKLWHDKKLKGAGYRRIPEIIQQASNSVGITEGVDAHKFCILHHVADIERLTADLAEVEAELAEKCQDIPYAENILEIPGLGATITAGILAEMGDIDRFDDAKEIQKLSGMGLVACSSGKHKGQTKISHRGRKRLRYWLYQGAMSVVAHNEAFRQLHVYYTTRTENPLKKMQSLIVIACKLLRIIFTILKKGVHFDPERMLKDIVRPEPVKATA